MASAIEFRPIFDDHESSLRSKSVSSVNVAPENTSQDAAREQPVSAVQSGYSAVNLDREWSNDKGRRRKLGTEPYDAEVSRTVP